MLIRKAIFMFPLNVKRSSLEFLNELEIKIPKKIHTNAPLPFGISLKNLPN